MTKKARPGPPRESWAPPHYDEHDIGAIKALYAGRATEQQQRHALELIVGRMAGKDDLSWRPGGVEGQRATDFAEGRRFVGLQLVRLINQVMPE